MIPTEFNEIAWRQSSPYMVKFGLHSPPFLETGDDSLFFQFPLFSQRLQMLQGLVNGDDYLTLVLGEQGCGKSTLLEKFIAHPLPSWHLCRIRCFAALDTNTILKRIATAFGVERHESSELIADINHRLHQMRRENLLPVIILDDGHELRAELLLDLFQLGVKGDFRPDARIIIFADPTINTTLASLDSLLPKQAVFNKLFILPFNPAQTEAYIKHRLEKSGFEEIALLTPESLQSIFELSGGLPGKINTEAHRLLLFNAMFPGNRPFRPVPEPQAKGKSSLAIRLVPTSATDEQDSGTYRPAWLLKQEPQLFTLQLAAHRKENDITKLIKKQKIQDKATYFHTYKNGKDWFTLIYGTYESRQKAEDAIRNLSDNLQKLSPWPRSLLSVHEAIKNGKKFVRPKK